MSWDFEGQKLSTGLESTSPNQMDYETAKDFLRGLDMQPEQSFSDQVKGYFMRNVGHRFLTERCGSGGQEIYMHGIFFCVYFTG